MNSQDTHSKLFPNELRGALDALLGARGPINADITYS